MPDVSPAPPDHGSPGPLRAAVVGTGAIVTGAHLPALAAHAPGVELVAAVDVDPARLEAFAAEVARHPGLGPITGWTDIGAMLAAERPDLVLIGTPPVLHREQTLAALAAGAWVWCEKPLCLSLAEFDEIAAAEREGGPYASVVAQHRHGSGAEHAHALLGAGELGAPRVAHCQTTWYRTEEYYAVPWRGSWASEGGGPTMGHGIHQNDLLLHLLGDWTEIRAMAARLRHDVETEDVSTALVRFANDAVATVVNSVLSPDEVSRVRIDCDDATVELTHLYGHTNADWRYTPRPGVEPDRVERWRTPERDVPSSHTGQLAGILAAMRAGVRPPGSGHDARRTLEFTAALYKAAFTGHPVRPGDIGPDDPYHRAMHGDAPGWAPGAPSDAAAPAPTEPPPTEETTLP
ncbi:Gfo/Idh/MocA family protein [Streptomyces sp. ST2-7A]|uniref:Gfo/Idh/MocA family protein n=1 Tax=Streptomyces sp. ST2-7A TaxID=2907214 RepID=UPI001F291395|nr:Gfo/Idh/MocA family oxidoreductase [Streptomyces sp. ST2-7A]MCE7081929.1 Gfo/Idh/MocA family oxidoreductase [Streptomyces sp. ST2-7A]